MKTLSVLVIATLFASQVSFAYGTTSHVIDSRNLNCSVSSADGDVQTVFKVSRQLTEVSKKQVALHRFETIILKEENGSNPAATLKIVDQYNSLQVASDPKANIYSMDSVFHFSKISNTLPLTANINEFTNEKFSFPFGSGSFIVTYARGDMGFSDTIYSGADVSLKETNYQGMKISIVLNSQVFNREYRDQKIPVKMTLTGNCFFIN